MRETDIPERPGLEKDMGGTEFARWYWTKEELVAFARTHRLPAAGGKQEIAARVAAFLDGTDAPPPAARRKAGKQLVPPLSAATVVPEGQRCSQVLRAWLHGELGPGFHFDAAMRGFFAAADGTTTLGDALAHWAATRGGDPGEVAPQFELNRFSRQWHRRNPGGTRGQMLAAWMLHRSLPVDLRGEFSGSESARSRG